MRQLQLLFSVAVLCGAVAAQAVVIDGGTVVSLDGSPSVVARVVMQDGRIAAVGPDAEVPDGARTIDAKGKWIIPGLIDGHVHFFQSGGLYTRPDALDLRAVVPYAEERRRIDASLSSTFRRYLRCGITTVVDVGGPDWNFEVRDRARATELAPRVAVAGPLIATWCPAAFRDLDDPPIKQISEVEAARAEVRRQVALQPDLVKIWFIGGRRAQEGDPAAVVRATIAEAHEHGIRVAVHATQLQLARIAVEAGCDVIVHSVTDGPVDDAFVSLLAEKGTVYTPTLIVGDGYGRTFRQDHDLLDEELMWADPDVIYSLFEPRGMDRGLLPGGVRRLVNTRMPPRRVDVAAENLERIAAAGVTIAVGTDAGNIGTLHGPSLFKEMRAMVAAGMTPADVLEAATVGAAHILDRQHDLGRIAPGAVADLVLLDADPLVDIMNCAKVWRVVKGGRVLVPDEVLPVTPLAVVQRQLNAYNAGNLDVFVNCYAPDVRSLRYETGEVLLRGRDAFRERYGRLFEQNPKLHCRLENRIVHGDVIIDHEHVTGLAGRDEPLKAVAIYEVKDGLIQTVRFVKGR